MLKKWLGEYIEINKKEILIVIGFLVMGIVLSVVVYMFAASETREGALLGIRNVFDISKTDTYVKTNIIANGIKLNILVILVFAVSSVTLFGKWIMYSVLLLKGAALSLYTILLFSIFGPLWGIVVTSLLVILVNMLYIPALIYLAVSFLEINFNIFNVRLHSSNVSFMYKMILVIFISFALMFSSIMVEQIASSVVLKIYTKI